MKTFFFFLIIFSQGLRVFSTPLAQPSPATTNTLTEITSDRMDANLEKNEALFTGNVRVKDATFFMTANEMTVYFDAATNGVERIYARGNVRIDQKNKKAEAQEATYYMKEARIVLKGNPKVHEEGKTLTGDSIIFYRNTQKTEVEGKTTLILTDLNLLKPKDSTPSSTNN